ncbi:MAG: hypothetical protein WCL50_06970, partial [Spirochaetota bacterium]
MTGVTGRVARRNSIRFRILGVALLAALVVATLFVSLFAVLRDSSFRAELEGKTRTAAERLASSLSIPLWVYIFEACDQIIAGEMKDADFSAIFLVEKSGPLVSGAQRDPRSMALGSVKLEDRSRIASEARTFSTMPVVNRGATIGEVTVYASGSIGAIASGRTLFQQILLALFEGAISAILAFVMVDRFISRRILVMEREMGRFTGSDL